MPVGAPGCVTVLTGPRRSLHQPLAAHLLPESTAFVSCPTESRAAWGGNDGPRRAAAARGDLDRRPTLAADAQGQAMVGAAYGHPLTMTTSYWSALGGIPVLKLRVDHR